MVSHGDVLMKIYTINTIRAVTLIGGPWAGAILFYRNFKIFNEPLKAKLSLVIGFIFTIALMGIAILLPGNWVSNTPSAIIPLIIAFLTGALAKKLQGEAIDASIEQGILPSTFKDGFLWSLIGIALFVVFFILFVLIPNPNTETMTFGTIQHEILYPKKQIKDQTVMDLGETFIKSGFFDKSHQKHVELTIESDTLFLNIYIPGESFKDQKALNSFKDLNQMIKQQTGLEYVMRLYTGNIIQGTKRIE